MSPFKELTRGSFLHELDLDPLGTQYQGAPETGPREHHARPFVGASQGRSWSHWVVLGAILWAFVAKVDQIS